MADLRSVLVVRLSSLGDVLFALPAVQALLASGRAERVSWLVEDRAQGLLLPQAGLAEILVYPRRHWRRIPGHLARLARRRDDLVLDLQGNLKSRLQLAFLRSPRKLGFDAPVAREGAQRALTERHVPPVGARHRVAMHLSILARLGIPVPAHTPRPHLPLDADALERTRSALATLDGRGPLVVLHPGTSAFGQLKRWDPERFGTLARRLATEHDARLLLSAGPGEDELARAARATAGDRLTRAPAGSLADLTALLQLADLVVAADSLPLHLANALGTPVVGLYGPKDPAVTGPYFDRARVVRSGVACSPCTLRRCYDRLCMDRLEVDAVARAAGELLAC